MRRKVIKEFYEDYCDFCKDLSTRTCHICKADICYSHSKEKHGDYKCVFCTKCWSTIPPILQNNFFLLEETGIEKLREYIEEDFLAMYYEDFDHDNEILKYKYKTLNELKKAIEKKEEKEPFKVYLKGKCFEPDVHIKRTFLGFKEVKK